MAANWIARFVRSLNQSTKKSVRQSGSSQRLRFRPGLEVLEDRLAPASLLVTSFADDGSVGTLRYEIGQANLAGGDTISFQSAGTVNLTAANGPLIINNPNLTIQGVGANSDTVSGQNSIEVFDIIGGTATISGLTISDGTARAGGAIFNGGTLTLNDCNLNHNSASIDNSCVGGAIYNANAGTMTINNTTLTYNSAAYGGDAIRNDGTLRVNGSTLANNSGGYGGAIQNFGTLTVDDSTFSNNSGPAGGAINNFYNCTVTVSNSTFSGNSSDSGGAINSASKLTVTGSTFSSNTSLSPSGGGGAIWSSGTASVTTTTFSGNSASSIGGGIYSAGILTVSNSTLSRNLATLNNGSAGGGIFNDGGTLYLNYSNLVGNSSLYGGGGIYSNGGKLVVSNSTVANSSGGFGGAINSFNAALTVVNSTFSGNSGTYGGGILNSYAAISVSNSTFSGNSGTYGGGGIYNYGGTAALLNTIIANSSAGGDLFLSDNGSFTGNNDLIDDSSAGTNGSNGYFGASSLYNVPAGLDPAGLQNNGGPTQTIALLPGSPAVNAGDDSAAAGLTTDQRGADFNRHVGLHVDIGAYELSAVIWTGAAGDNNWDNPNNWVNALGLPGVPGVGDDAFIGSGYTTVVHSGSNDGVNKLASESPITISGGTLSVTGSSTIDNNLTLTGGALAGTGDVTVNGVFTWDYGTTVGGTGSLTANGGMSIVSNPSSPITLDGRTLVNTGSATWTGGGTINVINGAAITNTASGTFDDQTDDTLGSPGSDCPNFTNAGRFIKSGGDGTTHMRMLFLNSGELDIQRGTLDFDCGIQAVGSSSTVDVTGSGSIAGGGGAGGSGTIGTITNSGAINVTPSATPLTVNSFTQLASGSLYEQIGGPNAGTDYGQIIVHGNVGLAGSLHVALINGFTPLLGEQFTIIDNRGLNLIAGNFAGLAEGATIHAGVYGFSISYTGGDGNDVVLTVTSVQVTPTVSLIAANAFYTGLAYDTANLTTLINPAAAPGSVSYVFYSDAGGHNVIATPVNAGTYYVQAFFASSDPGYTNAASSIQVFTITPALLTVDATTQGTLNIAKAGTISFALQITGGLVASNNDIAALFNGALFTIHVDGTSYSLTSTASVALDGTIHVTMQMSQGLQNALLTALSKGSTVDFSLSALSSDGDYSVAADAISRLISQGKLKFAVV
jgi:predicted outer membrane repeat protein